MEKPIITFPLLGLTIDAPNYFTVFGLRIYWYGVLIAAGFLLGVLYCLKCCRQFGLTQDNIYDAFITIVPCGIIGARAYYVIFNYGIYNGDWASMVNIRDGGLGIYGGIILSLIALFVLCRVKKFSFLALCDVAAFAVLIGAAIGRWGNFLNREAFGSITELPWKMGLTYANGTTVYVHPAFLYESLWNLLGFALLHFVVKKRRRFDGEIFALFAAWYGTARIVLEAVRTDNLLLMGTELPISQIVGAVSVLACIIVMFATRHKTADGLFVNKLAAAECADEEGCTEAECAEAECAECESAGDKETAADETEENIENNESNKEKET